MQSLKSFIRLLVTVSLSVSLVLPSQCDARKQLFSGSHSVDQNEGVNHVNPVPDHHDLANSVKLNCGKRNVSEIEDWGDKSCAPGCTKEEDCRGGEGYKCICDGPCGLSCKNPDEKDEHCGFPGRIENGRVLLVGKLGLYDYRNQLKSFSHNQKIIFECERGYALAHGPPAKTCRNGSWLPATNNPQCIETNGSSFRWIRSARRQRRAIKTRGGQLARPKGGGGGGGDKGGGPRRYGRKKGGRLGEDNDVSFGVQACPSLDHDDFMQVEVIRNGEDVNNTFSVGAVAKISCTPGFGANLMNETVTCEKGRWRPKLPQCSALPCLTPYIIHGTFYVGSKPLFFQELKPHDIKIDLKCSKGYATKGSNRLHCWYGDWGLEEAPECVPAGCRLPTLEKGTYLSNYKADMTVTSGTEINYICDDNYQKPYSSSSAKCDYGEWKPAMPKCIPNTVYMQRNFSLENYIPAVKKSCGSPPKEELAIAYMEGTPLEFDPNRRFPSGIDVMYRCIVVRPRAKNRWKITCDDGKWIATANNITCEKNISDSDIQEAREITRMVNSSCTYKSQDKHVVTFYSDQELQEEEIQFPSSTVLVSRCVDIGKFQLKGARVRKCVSGLWMGLSPRCDGLSQYHDYAVDKSPTILFRYVNGSIAQTIDGELIVYPGTTLHMECLYLRKFGRPSWEVSNAHRSYAEGWTEGIENRDPTLEYRLTIDNASENDSAIYSCSTPTRHSHQINIIIKKVDCPPLPENDDLEYSTNSTAAGTRVNFKCKYENTLVGNKEVVCQATGTWNGGLPRCENVECPDISMVPAMAPLAYTEITRNGTLKKNETAPPKITIQGRDVGGKVIFTCPQGFVVEGSTEAVCQSNGEWSAAMPLCKGMANMSSVMSKMSMMMPMSTQLSKSGRNWNNRRAQRKRGGGSTDKSRESAEVECQPPPKPENGYVTGTPPFKAGDLASIECNQGYMIEGQPMIACQDNGKWSRALSTTKCAPACTYPGTTIGGTISFIKFHYPIGETVEFNCTEGYELVGERQLRCLKTGKWSHSIPNCSPMSNDGARFGLVGNARSSSRFANDV